MSDIAIEIRGLGKRYRIGATDAGYKTLSQTITQAARSPFTKAAGLLRSGKDNGSENIIWALRNVDLEVKRGEVVGLIGRNGAGKTTLLKLLSRITEPTEGRANIYGRVGSLLEVGTGFHPELTGRENIYLNGSIMGMTKAEITQRFDEIVDFSEIERFLDTPVKHYSSGMYIRLAFAVAAHLETEILLVDEVLAVGDFKFQEKCLDKMKNVTEQGRTIIFVSHNMRAVSRLCSRAVLLADGEVEDDGPADDIVRKYLGSSMPDLNEVGWSRDDAPGNQSVRLLGIRLLDQQGIPRSEFDFTEPIQISVTFLVLDDTVDLYLRMYLENQDGIIVLVTTEVENTRFDIGTHTANYTIQSHLLNEGKYSIQQLLFKEGMISSAQDVARVDYPISFTVDYSKKFSGGLMGKHPGIIRPEPTWDIQRCDGEQ